MKKVTLLLVVALLSIPLTGACHDRKDLLTFASQHSVNDTAKQLVQILEKKGFTISSKVDHAQEAKNVGIELRDTIVIIFGNPKIGSKLMQCAPTIAIDLPQKALIWKDAGGKVWLSVNNPEYLQQRHKVKGCDPIFKKIKSVLAAISKESTSKQSVSK